MSETAEKKRKPENVRTFFIINFKTCFSKSFQQQLYFLNFLKKKIVTNSFIIHL